MNARNICTKVSAMRSLWRLSLSIVCRAASSGTPGVTSRSPVASSVGPGSKIEIGQGAQYLLDYTNANTARVPWLVLALAIVAVLTLIVVLRALLLPLIAVALNLATIAVALGALELLTEPHVLGGPGYIDAASGAGIISIMFVLSIDYEVLLDATIVSRRPTMLTVHFFAALPRRHKRQDHALLSPPLSVRCDGLRPLARAGAQARRACGDPLRAPPRGRGHVQVRARTPRRAVRRGWRTHGALPGRGTRPPARRGAGPAARPRPARAGADADGLSPAGYRAGRCRLGTWRGRSGPASPRHRCPAHRRRQRRAELPRREPAADDHGARHPSGLQRAWTLRPRRGARARDRASAAHHACARGHRRVTNEQRRSTCRS